MSDLPWIRLALAQGFRILLLFPQFNLTPLSWHLCSEVCFIECCWNTPSDFTGGVWEGVQIGKKKNQKQWYWPITRCVLFSVPTFQKEITMYHCPLLHVYSTFVQWSGQFELKPLLPKLYFHTVTCGNYYCVTEEEDSCPGSCGCPVPRWPYTGEEELSVLRSMQRAALHVQGLCPKLCLTLKSNSITS